MIWELFHQEKIKCLLARESDPSVWEFDEGDVVLEGGSCAAVARVLHEVVREEDLAPRLVPVQVVHTDVSVGAVGTVGKKDIRNKSSGSRGSNIRCDATFKGNVDHD